jgi:hypothetical protein
MERLRKRGEAREPMWIRVDSCRSRPSLAPKLWIAIVPPFITLYSSLFFLSVHFHPLSSSLWLLHNLQLWAGGPSTETAKLVSSPRKLSYKWIIISPSQHLFIK